jgi:hypothetical protein
MNCQNWLKVEDFSLRLFAAVNLLDTAAALQRFRLVNSVHIAQIASAWFRAAESRRTQLQHTCKVVEKQEAVTERRTPMAKGDMHISGRSRYPDLNAAIGLARYRMPTDLLIRFAALLGFDLWRRRLTVTASAANCGADD